MAGPETYSLAAATDHLGYADPAEDLIGILMTQRMMDSPTMPLHFRDFWTGAYTAIDD